MNEDGSTFVDTLLRERPLLHGETASDSWQIGTDVLTWLDTELREDQVTLETGTGYSTLVFAYKHTHHTAISPAPHEHERIKQWCSSNGLCVDRIRFIAGGSERVLPNLESQPLDLILIDGQHSFPWPFLDWYYTADRLKVGGVVVIDDTQLMTGKVLADFLRAEIKAGLWELGGEFQQAIAFRKVGPEVNHGRWEDQPWNIDLSAAAYSGRQGWIRFARKLISKR